MKSIIHITQVEARQIQIGEYLSIGELRLNEAHVILEPGATRAITISVADATIVITESALNAAFTKQPINAVKNLDIKAMSGKMSVSGRYLVGPVPIPFTLAVVPEIDGGARIHLEVASVHTAGLPLPAPAAKYIMAKLNDALGDAFDITRLPIPLRLTRIVSEPGRISLSATSSTTLENALAQVAILPVTT